MKPSRRDKKAVSPGNPAVCLCDRLEIGFGAVQRVSITGEANCAESLMQTRPAQSESAFRSQKFIHGDLKPHCRHSNHQRWNSFAFQIGDETRSGDLYYLGIDPRNADHNCSFGTGLRRLIDGWIETILANDDNRIFYLPFDFSDEFTRWLACEKSGSEITIVFGWAEVEGWSFSPSEFREHSRDLKAFRPDEPVNPQTFYTSRLLSNLRRSKAGIVHES